MCHFNIVNVREHLATAIKHFAWGILKRKLLLIFYPVFLNVFLKFGPQKGTLVLSPPLKNLVFVAIC